MKQGITVKVTSHLPLVTWWDSVWELIYALLHLRMELTAHRGSAEVKRLQKKVSTVLF